MRRRLKTVIRFQMLNRHDLLRATSFSYQVLTNVYFVWRLDNFNINS